jgi:hypothetical protein
VLAIAAANGQVSAYDPTIKNLLQEIRTAANSTGTISELAASPNTADYDLLVPFRVIRHTPTFNVTVNLTPKNRLQGSYYWQRVPRHTGHTEQRGRDIPGIPGVWHHVLAPHHRVHFAAFDDLDLGRQRGARRLGVASRRLLRQRHRG